MKCTHATKNAHMAYEMYRVVYTNINLIEYIKIFQFKI